MIDREFWQGEPIAPIRLFADLREFVLQRSHSRLPNWRFRVADDLVLYVQPRPAERRDRFYAFRCTTFAAPDPASVLTRKSCDDNEKNLWRLGFGIDAGWVVRPNRVGGPPGFLDDYDATMAFRSRMLAALRSGIFDRELSAGLMLSPHCLICGRGLTDPISIARWIGPECAGQSGMPRRVWNLLQRADLPQPSPAMESQAAERRQNELDGGQIPLFGGVS